METLALEISKILNITVEKAIELMPLLRSQFINYKMISIALKPVAIIGAVSGVTLLASMVVWICNLGYNDTDSILAKKTCKNIAKKAIVVGSIAIAISIAGQMVQLQTAPDFVILKEFLPRQ